MNINDVIALAVLALIVSADLVNSSKIFRRQVEPTLSSWVIFLAGTGMSFASYLVSSHRELAAGALNGADVVGDVIVILTILFFGATKWKLRPFEKYYFAGVLAIGGFWLFTSDAFHSNLLIQLVLTLGYIPTVHTIIKSKRNTESFAVWGLLWLASIVSLYPAFNAWETNGNILGLIYSLRSAILLSLFLALMFMYHPKESKELRPL